MKKAVPVFLPAAACLAGLVALPCAAEAPRARFTHKMPAWTTEQPLNPPREELARAFADPFGKVQTATFWYWMNGNISCDGIRRDLEAMKRAGIDRAYISDIGSDMPSLSNKPGPVTTFSPEWYKAVATAFETASRLGIELGMFNSPGWSQSGGPWVKPEQAMRRVVASCVTVEGPRDGVSLPAPKFESAPAEHARDVVAVAYPAPKGFADRVAARVSGEPLRSRGNRPLVVELEAPSPFTAQAAELAFTGGTFAGKVAVEAELDGSWKKLCETSFSRMRSEPNVGFSQHAPLVAAFAPVEAKRFRVTARQSHGQAEFSSVAVCAAPLVANAYEKSLAKMYEGIQPAWRDYMWPDDPPEMPGTALDASKAIVLRGKVAADGRLDWKVPPGRWAIYRFAAAPTGTQNRPANPEATGYEVDKMSREHVAAHFNAYLGDILNRIPPEHRKAMHYAVQDSYEVGGQNFTDGMAAKFKASFGYDPTPYLPALFGMSAGGRDASNRFLWDLRRFVADEVAYSYVAGLREASNARGLTTWLQCYGHWGFPSEFLQYGGQSDEVSGEFWSEGGAGNVEVRAASSCAHTYGKRRVWAESHTSSGRPFSRSPGYLKRRFDRFFAEGVNATLLTLFIHQPDERQPGVTAWFGNEFHRHNTWFGQMDILNAYIKRCNYMLQQGLDVADIAFFIGEDTPKMTGLLEPACPPGKTRQWDLINAEVLRETAGVDEKGRLSLPHGTKYEVLVLPRLGTTMRPEMLHTVERLVNDGAFVLGPKPLRSPSLAGQPRADEEVREIADRLWGDVDGKSKLFRRVGKGVIAWNLPYDDIFAMRKSPEDCAFRVETLVDFSHRTLPNAEIYFLANRANGKTADRFVFRTAGRIPELWRPVTGEMREAPEWRATSDGRTEVRLELEPMESVFVVFARPGGERTERHAPVRRTARELACAWELEFQSDPLHRGPAGKIRLDALSDLSKSADPAIRHYSGKVVYRTKFTASKPSSGEIARLSFGGAREIARVRVNGREAGGIWTAPYEVQVTDLLRDGENNLEVEVCTSWVNRLVGDAALPAEKRPTWISVGGYKANHPLVPSGLFGPTRLVVERQ